jgi:hypothetical protein
MPPTLLEFVVAVALVAVGIVLGDLLATRYRPRRSRMRGLPFDPRCWR